MSKLLWQSLNSFWFFKICLPSPLAVNPEKYIQKQDRERSAITKTTLKTSKNLKTLFLTCLSFLCLPENTHKPIEAELCRFQQSWYEDLGCCWTSIKQYLDGLNGCHCSKLYIYIMWWRFTALGRYLFLSVLIIPHMVRPCSLCTLDKNSS